MNRATSPFACLIAVLIASNATAADWPQWQGPDRTNVSSETDLLEQWPEGGPERVWLYDNAGLGYSGFSIVEDTLYTMGARDKTTYLIALDAREGTEKWSTAIGDILTNGWGDGPRATPTVDGERVYALTGQGALVCADATTGDIVWERNAKEFGGKKPNWGYTESVLVDGDKVVFTPGGKEGAIVALDKKNGELIWQSKDFTEGAQYASIIIAEHGGKRQYIQLMQKTLVGLDAESGDVLWKTDFPGRTAVIPTPIYHDGKVYITAGYGAGCKLVELKDEEAAEVYYNQIMKNHHGGVVLIGDHLYGYSDGPGWTCQEFETGVKVWNEKGAFGKGALTAADGKLYLLSERGGEVVLVDATTEGWEEEGRFTLEPQSEQRSSRGKVWTHPVISDARLYLRDQEYIYCYDIQAK